MGKASSKKQSRRQCIFCGVEGLTSEHFLPQWMHDLLILDGDYNGHQGISADVHIADGEASPTEIVRKRYAGPPWTRTFKVVCAKCNGGWMSNIENDVKGPLGALVSGTPNTVLSPNDQSNIAKWMALKTIVFEHGQPENDRIDVAKDVRETFRIERGNPPPNWWVYLGRCEGPRELQSITTPSVHQENGATYQTYVSSLALGRVFLQLYGVVNAPPSFLHGAPNPGVSKIVLIHPHQQSAVPFDDLPKLNQFEYERLAMLRTRLVARQVNGFPAVGRLQDYKAPPNIGRLKKATSK